MSDLHNNPRFPYEELEQLLADHSREWGGKIDSCNDPRLINEMLKEAIREYADKANAIVRRAWSGSSLPMPFISDAFVQLLQNEEE